MNKHQIFWIWVIIFFSQPVIGNVLLTVNKMFPPAENKKIESINQTTQVNQTDYTQENTYQEQSAQNTVELAENEILKKAEELMQIRLDAAKEIYNQKVKNIEDEKARLPETLEWNQYRVNLDKQINDAKFAYQESCESIKNSKDEIYNDAKNTLIYERENNGVHYD